MTPLRWFAAAVIASILLWALEEWLSYEAGCWYCHKTVWPWQRQGWYVEDDGQRVRWHGEEY